MPPLTRQHTLESILSWWSDSNLPGPTLDLHAVTKPLMHLMYRRQASNFLKRNDGVPLSAETLGIFWSYVSWKYVSSSTKAAILRELANRVKSENEARVVIESNMLTNILQLVQSSDSDIRLRMSPFLSNLARHSKSTAVAISLPLVALLRDRNMEVLESELVPLTRFTGGNPNGAEAAVEANLLPHAMELLESPIPRVRVGACKMLGNIAWNQTTAAAVVNAKPCKRLVTLLSDEDVGETAFRTLSIIIKSPSGAEAALAANVLAYVAEGLISPVDWIRQSACELLGKLGRHKATASAVLDIKPCERLVDLLSDRHVMGDAFDALSNIATVPEGAEAVVAANALEHVPPKLASQGTSQRVLLSIFMLLDKLARHGSTAQAVTPAVFREGVFSHLRDDDNAVRSCAGSAWQAINDYVKGPQSSMVVDRDRV